MTSVVRCWLPLVLSATLLAAALPANAAVALRGAAELRIALQKEPPCCVIDARSEDNQRKHSLPDALRYRPDLRIIPTASIVIVADQDQDAVKVGSALATQHPGKVIYAVRGGVVAWESVLKSLQVPAFSKAPGGERSGISFVIPHNTCETGTPLQILQSKPGLKR